MRRLIMFVVITVLLMSCSELVKQDVRSFIEGSYTRHFQSDFAIGKDSVVLDAEGDDHYIITKYTRFSRLKNGEPGKEELLKEKMMGIYDPEKEVINETKKGKVLHFNPEKNMMLIGASEYEKVK